MKVSEQGIKNLAASLAKFQEEVKNPANTAINPQFKSKYAPLDVVINTAKPILAKYGLSYIQSTGSDSDHITVTTVLLHESGEWIESDPLSLPAYQTKGGGVKEFNAQGAGSSLTYARRYSLSAMLGLSSEDDDDANGQVFGGGGNQGATRPSAPAPSRDKAMLAAKEKAVNAQANAPTDDLPFQANDASGQAPAAPSTPASTGGDAPIGDGQKTAINNMLNLVMRKKAGFDKEAWLAAQLASFGVASLNDLTNEQARGIIPLLNAELKK